MQHSAGRADQLKIQIVYIKAKQAGMTPDDTAETTCIA